MTIYSKDQYYEAKFQLRPYDEEVLKFIYALIDKHDVLISKEEKSKAGIDLYLTSKKFMIMILQKQLRKHYEGEFKLSRSLFGKDNFTSKLLYRSTLLFRLKKP